MIELLIAVKKQEAKRFAQQVPLTLNTLLGYRTVVCQ
jgi:hypothetical protein